MQIGMQVRKPGNLSLIAQASPILRWTSPTPALNLTSVTNTTATSLGPITIPDGCTITVQDGKTWSIT